VAALADWAWQGRVLKRTAAALDYVGVNYYSRIRVAWHPRIADAAWHDPHGGAGDRTDYGWEIYPPGLYDVLRRVGRLGLPVVITENGISDAADRLRAGYIVAHLAQAHRALRAGVDLRGYMHWSLMDNFEWTEGITQRFGLAAVDFDRPDKRRTPRPSASVYRTIAQANAVAISRE
jgi:beta-glucosidase/6-phospho-beta-glucosidase/beta-galactosidase